MNQVSSIMGQSQTHGGGGQKVRDPGGYTSSMSTGGTV